MLVIAVPTPKSGSVGRVKNTVAKKKSRKVALSNPGHSLVKTALKIGAKAPAFVLTNHEGKEVDLKQFLSKKRVVLYFYPRAMTPGCTVQACGIRDHIDEFRSEKAVIIAISPDKIKNLEKFQIRDRLNFYLLSDPDNAVATSYGVWGLKKFMGREYMGIRRTTFIIGTDGKIEHIMDNVNTKTHHNDVLDILRKV